MNATAENVSPMPGRRLAEAVLGGCHKAYGAPAEGEPAVIINPRAKPADLIAWAQGQVEVLEAFASAHASIPEEQTIESVRTAFATETMLTTIGQVLDAAHSRLVAQDAGK
jgi:hypothetical protein